MKEIQSSKDAFKSSLLYLYGAYQTNGFTHDEATKEVSYDVIQELKKLGMLNGQIVIDMNDPNVQKIYADLLTNVKLLATSRENHVSQVGIKVASLINQLIE